MRNSRSALWGLRAPDSEQWAIAQRNTAHQHQRKYNRRSRRCFSMRREIFICVFHVRRVCAVEWRMLQHNMPCAVPVPVLCVHIKMHMLCVSVFFEREKTENTKQNAHRAHACSHAHYACVGREERSTRSIKRCSAAVFCVLGRWMRCRYVWCGACAKRARRTGRCVYPFWLKCTRGYKHNRLSYTPDDPTHEYARSIWARV